MKKLLFASMGILLMLSACQPALPASTTTNNESTQNATSTEKPFTPTPAVTVAPTQTATEPPFAFAPAISLQKVAAGFAAPLTLTAPDDGTGRLFVVDQAGLIYVIDGNDNLLGTLDNLSYVFHQSLDGLVIEKKCNSMLIMPR